MNCKRYQELAIDIAFGESERTSEFDRHLDSCKACREEFAAYAFAAQGIEDVPAPPAPSLSSERLYSAIRSQAMPRTSRWLPRLALAAATASVALAAWVGFNRPAPDSAPPVVAATSEPQNAAPTGPIEIPENAPTITPPTADVIASASSPPRVRTGRHSRRNKPAPVPETPAEVPEELLAVVVGGAEGALDLEPTAMTRSAAMMMESGDQAGPGVDENPIVVIQPQGQATEKSSEDVSIGG